MGCKNPQFTSCYETSFKCPCGYEFKQKDCFSSKKIDLIKKLHVKKCKVAQECYANDKLKDKFTKTKQDFPLSTNKIVEYRQYLEKFMA